MTSFRLLRPEEVLARWPELPVRLSAAVERGHGECEVDDIRRAVLAGLMFVFADDQFALTCEFTNYPRKTVMVVGFGSGEIEDYASVMKTLEDFAVVGGASTIRAFCSNPAMVRYHQRFFTGVAPICTVLEKSL